MSTLKTVSDLISFGYSNNFGFTPISQRGSHIKLRRVLRGGVRQSLTIVSHAEVDRGTLHATCRQALRFISESELRASFHTG